MPQFLTVGLKATIVLTKKRLQGIPIDIAKQTVEENYDLGLYDYSETEHFYLWKLKESVLDSEIVPFLHTVYTFYYDKEEGFFQTLLGTIQRGKTYEKLFKLAKEAEYEHFELNNKQHSAYHLKNFGKHLQVDYNNFQLLKSEKIRIDTVDKTFLFLENCVKKTFTQFELSKALNISILNEK